MKHAILLVAAAAVLGAASSAAQGQDTVYTAGERGVTHPAVIRQVKPHYPKDALRAKKSAVVAVDCVVTTEGLPSDVRVEKPGDEAFDREAVKALGQWRFRPGTKDGKPVPVRIQVELTFTAK